MKKILKLLIPSCFTILLLLLVFIKKEVFPFGEATLVNFDLGQLFVPIYTHLWDAMHGTKSLFFDWYSASNNMIGMVSFASLLSPINLLFYFIPREKIAEFMSIYLIIKMALATLAMSFYLVKRYSKLPVFYHILFSIFYVFNGYILMYYTNINWLDFTVLFPILILSLDRLLIKRKSIFFICMLTLALILNVYLSYMLVIFIVLYSGLYIFLVAPKNYKKEIALKLAISSIISVLLSAWITVPAILQITSGGRYLNNGKQFLDKYFSNHLYIKALLLIGLGIPLMFTVKLLGANNKKAKFLSILSCLLIVPLIIERVNLMWHTGSYICFPARFAFILAFMLVISASYYLVHKKNENTPKTLSPFFHIAFPTATIIYSVLLLVSISNIKWDRLPIACNLDTEKFYLMFYILISLITCYFIVNIPKEKIKLVFLTIFSLIEIIYFTNKLILPTSSKNLPCCKEYASNYINDAVTIANNVELNDDLSKMKCKDFVLNSNYPFISKTKSIANWTNMLSSNTQSTLQNLGYAKNYTTTNDLGGTIFSDMILNFNYNLSKGKLNDELYSYMYSFDNFNLYKNNYELNCILANSSLNDLHYKNSFDYQNQISQRLFGFDILDIRNYQENIYIDDESIVYALCADSYNNFESNDIIFLVNYFDELHTSLNHYSSEYQTNYNPIIELGVFNNEYLNLQIISNNYSTDNILIGVLPISNLQKIKNLDQHLMENISLNNSSLSFNITSNEEKMLFLPITYDLGWNLRNNDIKFDVIPILNNSFIGIPLSTGLNAITLNFTPHGLKIGLIFTILGLVLLVLYILFYKKLKLKLLSTIVLFGVYIVFACVMIIIYIYPIFLDIKNGGFIV